MDLDVQSLSRPPDFLAAELDMHKKSQRMTPERLLHPPKDVQRALAQYREENSSVSGGGEDIGAHINQNFDPTSPVSLPPTHSLPRDPSNKYSLGSQLPQGVSWRYVDVLNPPEDAKHN